MEREKRAVTQTYINDGEKGQYGWHSIHSMAMEKSTARTYNFISLFNSLNSPNLLVCWQFSQTHHRWWHRFVLSFALPFFLIPPSPIYPCRSTHSIYIHLNDIVHSPNNSKCTGVCTYMRLPHCCHCQQLSLVLGKLLLFAWNSIDNLCIVYILVATIPFRLHMLPISFTEFINTNAIALFSSMSRFFPSSFVHFESFSGGFSLWICMALHSCCETILFQINDIDATESGSSLFSPA